MTPGAPIQLSAALEARLVEYLDQELEEALPYHEDNVVREVLENRALYKALPRQKEKNFPWQGAANLVIPIIATTVDSIVARVVNTIFGVEPFWTVRPLHKDFIPVAKPVEDFMDWSRKVEFDWYGTVKRNVIETVQDGEGWLKYSWYYGEQSYWEPTQGKFLSVIRRHPKPMYVPLSDVIRQVGIEDPRQAEWICHRVRLTDGQMRWAAFDKRFRSKADVEKCIAEKESDTDSGYREKLNTLYEFTLQFPLQKKDGLPTSVIVVYHRQTKTILRAIYNPDFYGDIPWELSQFVQVNGEARGYGIAQQLKLMQHEVSSIHNQQLDNATLSNTRFFLGKRNVFKNDTKIWPGRFLTSPNPKEDLVAMQMGDIYNSMAALEQSVMAFAERRSGISDYSLGRESSVLGDRATATGTLAILQEGNRRFDLNVRDIREAYGKGGARILKLNQQFRPKGLAYFVQGQEGALTEAAFDLPAEYIGDRLGLELTASSATINRQVEQAGLIQLVQILQQQMQIGQSVTMMIASPQVDPLTKQYIVQQFTGIVKLTDRIAQTFDQKNSSELVAGLQFMEAMTGGMAGPNGGGAQGAIGQMGPGGPGGAMAGSM